MQDLSKIPTKDHGLPTKDFIGCLCVIQLHQITQGPIASKVWRCIIGASSQMIRLALHTNSATFICCVMLQVNSLCRLIKILNLEWAVLPPRSGEDAILDEATTSTILPYPRRQDKIVVQTNVLPVPPLPKNSLPSLFVTTFKIVSYALR